MPDTLPAKDAAPQLDLDPLRIKGVTAVTEPFRSELPGLATSTVLHHEPVLAQTRPVRRRQIVSLGYGNRQAGRKIG